MCNSQKVIQNQMCKEAGVSLMALASGVSHFTVASVLYIQHVLLARLHAITTCSPNQYCLKSLYSKSLTKNCSVFTVMHKVFCSYQTL
ncbi:hypothetical protein I79_025817 [Cricetulus griseus]|uniref:Uncharacterized protein n=1 Tax=Cricetulus griseus TaxID=10029 RepID=G3IPB1_CRIGR|nr:hypothetical protein I79_025817 [Cricetulus griseus]